MIPKYNYAVSWDDHNNEYIIFCVEIMHIQHTAKELSECIEAIEDKVNEYCEKLIKEGKKLPEKTEDLKWIDSWTCIHLDESIEQISKKIEEKVLPWEM